METWSLSLFFYAKFTYSFMNRNKKGVIHMAGFKRDPKTGKVKLSLLAVYWHEVNGMSVDEIAELLKEPKDTIQKWIDDFDQHMSTKE